MPKPSYADGMYPLVGRPKYPSLWQGCVFAGAPCMGPSGLTLVDWSPSKQNGALTNMDPATDWAISGGRYALDFDGSNDHCVISDADILRPAALTVAAWTFCTSAPSGSKRGGVMYSFGSTTPSGNDWSLSEFGGSVKFSSGATQYSSTGGLSRDVWTHLAFTRGATGTLLLYINGANVAHVTGLSLSFGWTAGTAIGHWYPDAVFSWQGGLDDLRVYNRDLSPSMIQRLAMRRGIAYEVAEQQCDPGTNRRRRVLIGAV